jgi:hypothetical protein
VRHLNPVGNVLDASAVRADLAVVAEATTMTIYAKVRPVVDVAAAEMWGQIWTDKLAPAAHGRAQGGASLNSRLGLGAAGRYPHATRRAQLLAPAADQRTCISAGGLASGVRRSRNMRGMS